MRRAKHRNRSFSSSLGSLKPQQASQSSTGSPGGQTKQKFPNNIQFLQGNYVLDCDELLGQESQCLNINLIVFVQRILLLSSTQ